jgi:hypothetical protein
LDIRHPPPRILLWKSLSRPRWRRD